MQLKAENLEGIFRGPGAGGVSRPAVDTTAEDELDRP